MDAKLLILRYCEQEKRRPRTSLNYDLVELAGFEPASENHSSLVLHAYSIFNFTIKLRTDTLSNGYPELVLMLCLSGGRRGTSLFGFDSLLFPVLRAEARAERLLAGY